MSLEIFNLIVYIWIAIALVTFPFLLKVTQPYGRHSKSGWGPMVNNRWGWFLMEIPALLVFAAFVLTGDGISNIPILVFFLFWIVHYFNRSVVFPFRLRTGKKKMPIAIMGSAIFFNLVNGFVNGYWFGYLSPVYSMDWFTDFRFIGGAVLFITGFFINQYHDKILIGLRKNSNGEYKIPYGGLFRTISCPNFFGEIIEWAGFALMTWCLPALSFSIWTFVNLVPRALDHHRWYKQHFPDYPEERRAIFPFLL